MNIPRNMIGPKLREIRNQRGLTQADLALMCQRKGWDLSRETLAKIENQTRWVADFELVFFSTVLGLSLHEIIGGTSSENLAKKMVLKLERRVN